MAKMRGSARMTTYFTKENNRKPLRPWGNRFDRDRAKRTQDKSK